MSAHRRPVVTTGPFHDADGAVIPYGDRWGSDGPPEDSYSAVTHPERFRPLHTIADALVADLVARYDVEVSEASGDTAGSRADTVLRTTELRPRDPAAAPLTVGWTAFPGLVVAAGLRWRAYLPPCGCDACDDTVDRIADELEWTVGAVTAGAFREWHTRNGRATWCGSALGPHEGRESSGEVLAAPDVGPVQGPPEQRWVAWPRRLSPQASPVG